MRAPAARLVGMLACAALTACSSSGGGESKSTACGDMKREIIGFGVSRQNDPGAAAQAYADAARKLRTEVAKVGDLSVRNAALRVSDALDGLATDMRSLAAGNATVPRLDQLTASVAQLQQACGS